MKREEILKIVESESIKFIYLVFSDITGELKKVTIPSRSIDDAIEGGVWFDGSSVEGFSRIYESDMLLKPDCETFTILPWTNDGDKVAQILCNVYHTNDKPFSGDPREVLRRLTAKLEKMGMYYLVGPEIEFFLIDRDDLPSLLPHDRKGYFDLGVKSRAVEICQNAMRDVEAFGVQCESYHHEVSPGQHETDLHYDRAIKIADGVLCLKQALRVHARAQGFKVSFMPKPISGINGSGMHVHQSICDAEGKNLFYDPKGDYNISELATHFLAGQMAHARALAAIVAPTVNSYKRLVPGFEAPVYICWGRVNRSALIRIPNASKNKIAAGTRLELRCPDPSSNPYLAFAAMLAAGLDGIERKLTPPAAIEENVYGFSDEKLIEKQISILPQNIHEAVGALEQDGILREMLGYELTEHIIQAKRQEWKDFLLEVTPWEVERYL